MDKKVKKKWLKALRSGEYKKTRGYLRNINSSNKTTGYCCFGVLCELYSQETGLGGWSSNGFTCSGLMYSKMPPVEVRAWAGFSMESVLSLSPIALANDTKPGFPLDMIENL